MGVKLTDFMVLNAKPAPGAEWAKEVFDTASPGLALRITPDGHKSFVWRGRVKGRKESIRVTLGATSKLKLKDARERARELYHQAHDDLTDPRIAWRAKAAEALNLFEIVAEDYIRQHVSTLRSKDRTEAEIRQYLMKPWKGRPAASITADDVADVIRGILEDGKGAMARLVLSHAKGLFRWAAMPARGTQRLRTNPAVSLSAKKDFGITLQRRQVTLIPENIRLVWNAADKMPYPAGPYFKLLLLSGQRRGEVGEMQWSELDLDREKVWLIPAERMKGTNERARAHEVPLSPAMLAILLELRETRGKEGDYVFSTNSGKRPIGNFGDLKADLDQKVSEIIEQDGLDIKMPAWTIHDLRRTMRTNLGAIPAIPENVAERVIAHVPGGIVGTYNVHQYRDEKRQALTLWADRLAQIINPPPVGDNVVTMRTAAQ